MNKRENNIPEEFRVDVASSHVYQNQDAGYHEAFTRWRNDPGNRYGYRFVRDTREHTYVDGEGYAESRSENAERLSLRRCFGFLGMSMLVYFLLSQMHSLLLKVLFTDASAKHMYFSDRSSRVIFASKELAVSSGFACFSLLLVLILYLVFVHLPVKVALPSARVDPKFFAYSFTVAIMMMVVFHIFDIVLSLALQRLGIDVTFYSFSVADSSQGMACYIGLEMLLQPILLELVFRGCILQLFRQFGDRFAILVSSFAAACCYFDITKMMYVFCWGVILGIITIKSGSIVPAAVIRVVGGALTLSVNTFWVDGMIQNAHLVEVVICLSLMAACSVVLIVMRMRLIRPFRIDPDTTALTVFQKIREVLNSPWSVIWLTLTLLSVIVSVELV